MALQQEPFEMDTKLKYLLYRRGLTNKDNNNAINGVELVT
jgi:hypothetical protein